MSVDGTDFQIQEPSPFSPSWFSHKFKSAGLRYEIAISTVGDIVWINGPFQCGKYSDLKIFNSYLSKRLRIGEKIVSDAGYKSPKCVLKYDVSGRQKIIHKKMRARHEAVNRKLKIFKILQSRYRHRLDDHHI